jgi:ABC-type Mn2+/Zn2+ transport system permease subunit
MIIGYVRRHGHLSEDSAIGIGYVAAIALARFSWVCAPL